MRPHVTTENSDGSVSCSCGEKSARKGTAALRRDWIRNHALHIETIAAGDPVRCGLGNPHPRHEWLEAQLEVFRCEGAS